MLDRRSGVALLDPASKLRGNLARQVPVKFIERLDAAHAMGVEAARAGAVVALIRNTVD